MKAKKPFIDLQADLFGRVGSKYLRAVWRRHRRGAKARGIGFTIEPSDVVRLYQDQNGLCKVTGLAFNFVRFPAAFVKHPFSHSIDRIASDGDYTPDNVQLVCMAVNFGMGQWGQELFMQLARAAVKRENELRAIASASNGPSARLRARHRSPAPDRAP